MKRTMLFLLIGVIMAAAQMNCSSGAGEIKREAVEIAAAPERKPNNLELEFDEHRLVFLLIGQSNMAGGVRPDRKEDIETDPRITVLAYLDSGSPRRTYNKWHPAKPPLHGDWGGIGIGDYFSKNLIKLLPEDYSIGLVPCAISGIDIDFYRKNVVSRRRDEFSIPPDNKAAGAYDWVVERAKLAQKAGVLAGILFHQGESDSGQKVWLDKVDEIVWDLRNDLGMPDLPFLAGELYYEGACAGHNVLVRQIPDRVENAWVISAEDLTGLDQFHFDLEGQREFGKRYADKMFELLKQSNPGIDQ